MDILRTRPPGDRRPGRLLWLGGAAAATILALGINGTLASWTQAIVTNDTNTTKATDSVALEETSGAFTCETATTATNTATCSTINEYGGTTTPLDPDGVNAATTTVTLKNTGTAGGALTLVADACTGSGGAVGSAGDICAQVEVEVDCGGVKYAGTLSAFDAASAVAIATLASGATISCDITVTLPSTAPSDVAGMTASQPLVWTLDAV